MRLSYSDYLELAAPHTVVAALLRDEQFWARLVVGAERLGELWRHGDELYRVNMSFDGDGQAPTWLRWLAEPVANTGPSLELELRLHDAAISTHVTVALTVSEPNPGWWRPIALRPRVRAAVRAAAATMNGRAEMSASVPSLSETAPLAAQAGSAQLEQQTTARRNGSRVPSLLDAPSAQAAPLEALQTRYPQTVAHFQAMGALDYLERVARLEHDWERILRGEYNNAAHQLVDGLPSAEASPAYDLIYAGGGLGLLHAAVMAGRYGRRVMLFDRGEVGCAHREWNISRDELQALVSTGVVSWNELSAVVMREYRNGLVRFHAGPDSAPTDLWMPEVLNVALDAGALLRLMRRKLEAAGGVVCDGRGFRTVRVATGGDAAVEVELEDLASGTVERYRARLLLDGMGSTSPLALQRFGGQPFAGVCPTVGTVASGFAEGEGPQQHTAELGDILVSVADAQRGEQLMWEGFPGRGDELTVYLFYYATLGTTSYAQAASGTPRYSLLDLFEQYFALLPTYKRPGPAFRHHKPVYGYIPARHSLRQQEAALLRGVLPVGDSAAQQSPLTFCGFGSHVRNLQRTTALLDYALRHELLQPAQLAQINAFQVNVSLNWVFSRFMQPWDKANDVNWLQNLFLEVLNELGAEHATRFFRDRMRWGDYLPMLLGVVWRDPRIVPVAFKVLGRRGIVQWIADYGRFSAAALGAAAARRGGAGAERVLLAAGERVSAALGLRLRARYAEWRAMGWV